MEAYRKLRACVREQPDKGVEATLTDTEETCRLLGAAWDFECPHSLSPGQTDNNSPWKLSATYWHCWQFSYILAVVETHLPGGWSWKRKLGIPSSSHRDRICARWKGWDLPSLPTRVPQYNTIKLCHPEPFSSNSFIGPVQK